MSQNEIAAGTADRMKNVTDFSVIESNITEIKSILLFFDSLRSVYKELHADRETGC